MVSRRVSSSKDPVTKLRPATTPEARENQLIARAADLAERQLADGTASAQVITHFLKLGSSREKLEQERLANENKLLRAKQEAIDSQVRVEELYKEALSSMRAYSGSEPLEITDDFED